MHRPHEGKLLRLKQAVGGPEIVVFLLVSLKNHPQTSTQKSQKARDPSELQINPEPTGQRNARAVLRVSPISGTSPALLLC